MTIMTLLFLFIGLLGTSTCSSVNAFLFSATSNIHHALRASSSQTYHPFIGKQNILSYRRNVSLHASISPNVAMIDPLGGPDATNNNIDLRKGAISMNVDELAMHLGGWGRAKLVWDYYRIGVDPLKYFGCLDTTAETSSVDALGKFVEQIESQDEDIRKLLPTSRKNQPLGRGALEKLKHLYGEYGGSLEGGVARLSHVSKSKDGTTKLLIALKDGMEVETVIIPWFDKGWSTICIS